MDDKVMLLHSALLIGSGLLINVADAIPNRTHVSDGGCNDIRQPGKDDRKLRRR
jgi:hypothetical protein